MHPIIRDIGVDDLPALHEINDANVPEVGEVTADQLARLIELSEIAVLVEIDGVAAGFALVLALGTDYQSVNYRWFSERYDEVMYLDRVAFDARFQRRGLGTLLYDEIERQAADAGIAAVTLEVNVEPANPPSMAFHGSRGYAEVGRQDTPYGTVVSMMRKELGR
jgi:hypothetical protein